MMTGMNRYDDKEKRKMRRRNHIAKDLQDRKYHQRVKEGKRRKDQNRIDWRDYDEE